jgi:hypothetical protein
MMNAKINRSGKMISFGFRGFINMNVNLTELIIMN